MSNISGEEGSFSSGEEAHLHTSNNNISSITTSNGSTSQSQQQQPLAKKKRNLPGNPDPNAEVVALSPTTLMATNRFVCEICNKGFQRDQNLQLHRRGHNLPWKLRQRTTAEVKKRVYICPEPTCVHHNPSRALGDLTGIKKHYSRKHGEKKNGNVINVQKNMLCNLIGRLIKRHVEQENTNVTVVPFFLGGTALSHIELFVMHWPKKTTK